MKKLISSKKTVQKILIVIIMAILINFVLPTYSSASIIGGILINPIVSLISTIADMIPAGLQYVLVDGDVAFDGDIFHKFLLDSEDYVGNENDAEYKDIKYQTGDNFSSVQEVNLDDLEKGLMGNTNSFSIPIIKYSPDRIFSGQIPAFDINFINPIWNKGTNEGDHSVATQLHDWVAKWYVALRNLAIIGLMIVLVYVGIRILLSSTASDKSKYKQMLMNWLVAMCLLFFMHYIMAFTITITQEITNAISGNIAGTEYVNKVPVVVEGSNVKFNTDLMGLARFKVQYNAIGTRLLFLAFYILLVGYTLIFTLAYLKRTIIMAFLTFIAPLMALTYPIDKLRDGRAQAFNSWLKEYVFNALLQPFHLIIYTVFISSAMEFATSNLLYAIVAIASIKPAEKILRKFFGFDQASTASPLSAFAGGAMANQLLQNAVKKHAGGKGGNGGKDGGNGQNNIRTKENGELEDPNAPSGTDGYESNHLSESNQEGKNGQSGNGQGGNGQDSGEPPTPQQQMLDTYDENYGTEEWDPQERDAMAREANQEQGGMDYSNYSDDELREMGLDDETIAEMRGTDNNSNPQEQQRQGNSQEQERQGNQQEQQEQANNQTDSNSQENVEQGKRSFGTKVGDGFKGAGRSIKNKATMTVGNKHWRRKVGKNAIKGVGKGALKLGKGAVHLAGRAAGAAAIGSLGVMAGILGDDYGDILKYGAAGAALGGSIVGNSINRRVDKIGRGIGRAANVPIQGFVEGFSGKTSTQRRIDARKEELTTDQNFIEGVRQNYRPDGRDLSGRELLEATERAAEIYNYGITDTSEIAKTLKLEDGIKDDFVEEYKIENPNSVKKDKNGKEMKDKNGKQVIEIPDERKRQMDEMAKVRATVATKWAKKIKDPTKLANEDYTKTLTDTWSKQIMRKNSALSEKDANRNAQEILKNVKKYHKMY